VRILDLIDTDAAEPVMIRLVAGNGRLHASHGLEVLVYADGPEGAFVLRAGESDIWTVEPTRSSDEFRLRTFMGASGRIAGISFNGWLESGAAVTLRTRSFERLVQWPESLAIAVGQGLSEEMVRRAIRRRVEFDAVAGWLEDELTLSPYGSGGAARMFAQVRAGSGSSALRLIGRRIAADIERNPDGGFRLERIVWRPKQRLGHRGPLTLLSAPEVQFTDGSPAALVRSGEDYADFWAEIRSERSYLGIWSIYNDLERTAVVARAQRIGALRYTSVTQLPDGSWQFHLDVNDETRSQLDRLAESGEFAFTTARRQDQWLEEIRTRSTGPGQRRRPGFSGSYIQLSRQGGWIRVTPRETNAAAPADVGYLVPDMTGDHVRLRRRQDARDRLANRSTPMPQLAFLLDGRRVPRVHRRSVPRLSSKASRAFGGTPTPRQKEALEIALATPDIALIQGPPGTGKTRLIAALQNQLAETTKSRDGLAGQILLTSYQHEAVENVADRTEIFGLPAVKVDTIDQLDRFDGLEKWRRERIAALQDRLGESVRTPLRRALREARILRGAYLASGGALSDAGVLLRNLYDLGRPHLDHDLLDRIDSLERDLDLRQGRGLSPKLRHAFARTVRGLRCTAEAFADDGPESIARILGDACAADLLEESEQIALQEAFRAARSGTVDLEAIAWVQCAVLDRLADAASGVLLRGVSEEVDRLSAEMVDALLTAVERSAEGVDEVLAHYLHELESDPAGVRTTLMDYTVVLAATCQKAAGEDMRRFKGSSSPSTITDITFGTVLVDEAARANPLDLLIPLVRAGERIILVGDHRQLPHVVDTEVEFELERRRRDEGLRLTGEERLRVSLFEHLFKILSDQEAHDGIRRTITLDAQFRMHPVLGEFVSRTFYEPHGEWFGSPIDASHFSHGIDAYGSAAAAFVHVPRGNGPELKGRSKSRPAEAQWIAKEVDRMIRGHPNLSVGVIAFYRAQVDCINDELSRLGIMDVEGGVYHVRSEWEALQGEDGRIGDRLRIGTVDAFQGREFDVVFLSMTRSNTMPTGDELALRRRYGHLMLENRLCVAMSRQRRLLVVVGDRDMLAGEAANTAVPGLVRFLELCQGDRGRVLLA
jgi:hypothetical protein